MSGVEASTSWQCSSCFVFQGFTRAPGPKQIEYKNIKQIPEWQDNNPDCLDSETKKHQEYQYIINKSMGGITDDENEYNYNKIIKNVSKEVFIDKPN